jgi:hypothetical protein
MGRCLRLLPNMIAAGGTPLLAEWSSLSTMTAERMRECMAALGWETGELSRRLGGMRPRSVREMLRGSREIPEPVGDWLEAMVRHMQEAPPPPQR